MDELQKLLDALKGVDQKIDALLANESLTAEQEAERVNLQSQRQSLLAKIKSEKDRLSRDADRKELERDAAALKQRTEAEAKPGTFKKTDAGTALKESPIPATAKRPAGLKNFRGDRNGMSAELRAFRFGMWAMATLARQLPNRYSFEAASKFVKDNMAVVTSKDASGIQYLIPEEFSFDIVDLREMYGVARRLIGVTPMANETKQIPRRQGGLTAYFVGEGAAGTESQPVWDNIKLIARKLMVMSRVSNEVVEDLAINWGDMIAGEIAYAFAYKEDLCAFLGDGTSTYGNIVGVATKLQDVDGSGTDSAGLVTGAGNAYSELTIANFNSVIGKLPQYADSPNACWLTHRSFYYSVMRPLEEAAGGTSASEMSQGDRRPRPLFRGYPVEFSQVMPNAEANSQVCALLGDFSMGAKFGDRGVDSVEFSEHATVNGESVWERDEISVRGRERIDITVHDVGDASTPGPIVGLQTAGS